MSEQPGSDNAPYPPAAPSGASGGATHSMLLRFVRLLSGFILLAVSWGGVMLAFILALNLRDNLGHVTPTSLHLIAVMLLDGMAVLWLLAVVFGCLLTSAMSFVLAFTRRGW